MSLERPEIDGAKRVDPLQIRPVYWGQGLRVSSTMEDGVTMEGVEGGVMEGGVTWRVGWEGMHPRPRGVLKNTPRRRPGPELLPPWRN